MKKHLFTYLFILTCIFGFSQRILSEKSQISLLTAEKGSELYSAYGHSSIRIKDPKIDLDIIFNYGTFEVDDNELVFLAKFVKGTLDYTLSTEPFDWYLGSYSAGNRGITEQVFDLNLEEKQHLFNRLIVNYETDERYYRYDFFFDNCASRIHEILKEVLGDSLSYGQDINENSAETFRELIAPAFDFSPWADFGVGIIMGYPTDRIATNKEKMFLPVYMKERFENATYKNKNFIEKSYALFLSKPKDISTPFYTKPIFIFTCLFIIVSLISFVNFKNGKHYYSIDYVLFFITGFIGVFFLFMWFGTRHFPTFQNMNMFWAMPFNLIALFFLKKKIIKKYLLFMIIVNIVCFFILPQVFHLAILPIALMMAVRYFTIYKQIKF